MVYGNECPTCDTMIDFINCKQVGVSDGLQNILWLGTRAFGNGFCDWIMSASQTNFFQIWFPGFDDYTAAQCANLQSPTETAYKQQRWCFWATSPAMVLPLTIGVLGATLMGFVVPAILNLIIAFAYFLAASPLIVTVPGGGSQYFYHPGDTRLPDEYIESGDMEAVYWAAVRRRRRTAALYQQQLRQRGYVRQ